MAALGVALVVQALWVSHPLDAACSREVSRLVLERYGPGQALVAVDGRFAYGARGRALVPPTTDPEDALALARRRGARLWLTPPAWVRPPWTPSRLRARMRATMSSGVPQYPPAAKPQPGPAKRRSASARASSARARVGTSASTASSVTRRVAGSRPMRSQLRRSTWSFRGSSASA